MKNRLFLSCLLQLLFVPAANSAQTEAFTYQGRLLASGQPANGSYDLRFTLADNATQGNYVAGPLTNAPVLVSNGLFTVTLDFGTSVFDGSSLWLEIEVRTNGSSGPYLPLSPRQAITLTPYAAFAHTASTAAVATGLLPGATITGDGAGITNLSLANIPALTVASATTNGLFTSNLFATLNVNRTMRRNAGLVPNMGWMGGIGYHWTDMIEIAQILNTNGWVDLGYNTITVDAKWGTNDALGNIWPTTNFAPNGIPDLVQMLATNRCYLGLHTFGTVDWPPVLYPNRAYDMGYRLGEWGVRRLWIDGVYYSDPRTTLTLTANGADAGTLEAGWEGAMSIYAAVAPTEILTNAWMPNVLNETYVGTEDSQGSVNPTARQRALLAMFSVPSVVGPGFHTFLGNVGMPDSFGPSPNWWTTNYARTDMGTYCMAPVAICVYAPAASKMDIVTRSDAVIFTNQEAIRINQDPLGAPGLFLSTNIAFGTNYSSQKVLYRLLANGDLALGCWNLNTNNVSLFTVPLSKIPYLFLNGANVRDVFERTNGYVAGTLSSIVNTGGFNLYRLSR